MQRLQELYVKNVVPALKQKFGYTNMLAVPKMQKVVLNIGLGKSLKDPKFVEVAIDTLERITGQKPVTTLSKKSISNFKVREGQVIGAMVTLRGKRMYDFIDKLISIAIPRVRDFRGLDIKSVDKHGNLSLGFREHMAFPEIKADEIEKVHGLQITVVANATKKEEGQELYKLLGFPFRTE